jgi:hypothetical protein
MAVSKTISPGPHWPADEEKNNKQKYKKPLHRII